MSTVGVFSTVGDIMINVGDILSTVGDIMSTVGVFSTVGDIMMHVGGYHEYCGGKHLLFEYPMVLNTPTVLMISPTCIMKYPPHVS